MPEHQMHLRVTPVVWDRTINLPFLATVAGALMAAIIWTSTVNSRLQQLEERTKALPEMQERIARMDERGEASKATLSRIEALVYADAQRAEK